MGDIKKPLLEKLMSGFIYSDRAACELAKKEMVKKFGPIDLESEEFDFNYTDYYAPEMGGGLKRRFISFAKLVDPSALAGAKLFTDKIEKKHLQRDTKNRIVNIDPGLLSHSKLVLATTKNFSHRIYLGRGIYAEVTLQYRGGKWVKLDWTYPDYATTEYQAIFDKIRKIYAAQAEQPSKKAGMRK
jgi:hypothetical protein